MRRTININHQKINEEGGREENNNASKFGLIFSLFLFFIFSFCASLYMPSIFYFSLFSACVIIVEEFPTLINLW
jgi:hypothetical protein